MTTRRCVLRASAPLILSGLLAPASLSSIAHAADLQPAQPLQSRADWASWFADAGVDGTVLMVDQRTRAPARWVHGEARAQQRHSPASTFKLPHSLFALDAGLLRDEFQVVPWDGVKRGVAAWNQDQNLRSAMRNSTVWVYQGFARQLGEARERDYLRRTGYGNEDPTGADPFWVDGRLAISAAEQIGFLERLYRNQLPFSVEHQRLLKDVMVIEAGRDWILRAKSGWSGKVGWWVGWVEWPDGPVFFALNIDTPNRMADIPKRDALARRVLQSIAALPAAAFDRSNG